MCQPKVRRQISLGFSAEQVEEGQHICYLYNDDRERLAVLARYFEAGRREGEKLLYLVDSMTPRQMIAELERLGLDVRSRPEVLTVAEAGTGYCPGGDFDPDATLDMVKAFYVGAVEKEGFSGARGTGEMGWCLTNGTDRRRLMEYEARLTRLLADCPYTACCQYDTRRFWGDVVLDVLQTHPLAIVRGQLVKNPFFVEPEIFLARLRASAGEGTR